MAEREDALTMGARLKAEEKAASEARIAQAFAPKEGYPDDALTRKRVAYILWSADTTLNIVGTPVDALEFLCMKMFGCSYDELMAACDDVDWLRWFDDGA